MPTTLQLGLAAWMPLPYMMERGQPNTLEVRVARNGEPATIESGTYAIFDPTGAPSTSGTVTVGPEPGLATISSTPSTAIPYGEGWRVTWALIIEDEGEDAHTFENAAMIVRERLVCPVTTTALWTVAPALNPSKETRVTDLSELEQASLITTAWVKVQQRLLEYGRRPFLVVGNYALHEVTLQTALHLIYAALSSQAYEAYGALAEQHRMQAEEAWKRVRLDYDMSQDGVLETRLPAKPGVVWFGRGS